MKRLCIWIAACFLIVIAVDLFIGHAFKSYTSHNTLPGDYEMVEHVMRDFNEDILVLGSSVALNDINTPRLTDSLNINSYNGGANGQQMPFYLTSLKAAIAQKKPRLIVLGLSKDNLTNSGLGTRYNFLMPYYGMGIADIDSCMNSASHLNRYLLKSNLYRYNTIWFRIGLYFFVTAGEKGERGYIAKPVPTVFPGRFNSPASSHDITPEREREFTEFVNTCRENDIRLVVLLTPVFESSSGHDTVVSKIEEICHSNGFSFYDDRKLLPFDQDSTLFYDYLHLNGRGALIYTDTISYRLKHLLEPVNK